MEASLEASEAARRANAAWQLAGAVGPSSALQERLFRMVAEDPDEKVRLAAVWAAGHWVALTPPQDPPSTATRLYDEPPQIVVKTKPVPPAEAIIKHVQGHVLVELLIDERGGVAHAEVRESIPLLDQASLDCVRQWSFAPARRQGRPVPSIAQAVVTFRIF